MTRIAFLFPGQGSQRVGMGRDLVEKRPELIERHYRAADEILGFRLSQLCWEGPVEELRRTDVTQPAIFVTSVAMFDALRSEGVDAAVVAGHSVGEYAALVCAGALGWEEALRLVRKRGELMAAVNARTPGRMAAIENLPAERVQVLCAEAQASSGEIVEVASYNHPGQTVVSGTAAAVERVVVAVGGLDGVRAVMLGVGAPFHCSLMRELEDAFGEELAAATFSDPQIPVVSSVTATYVRTAEEVVAGLRQQLAGPVRWTDTLGTLHDSGVDGFVEVGPGRVLNGFCGATYPDTPRHSTADRRRFTQALAALPTTRLVAPSSAAC